MRQKIKEIINKRISICKVSFMEILAFRISVLSIVISTMFLLVLSYYLWRTIYSNRIDNSFYNFPEIITYIYLAIMMNAVLNTPRRTPLNISRDIRTGQIAQKLLKPVSYYEINFWHCIGRGLFFCLAIVLPVGFCAYFIMDIIPPASIIHFIAFLISFLLGYFIEISLNLLIAGLILFTVQSKGLINLNAFFSFLLSGRLIPLSFFPIWLKKFALVLPYHCVVSSPINIYLGKNKILETIGLQLFWVILLLISGNLIYRSAYKKMEIVGG